MAKNKINQTARREVRAYVQSQFQVLNKVIKPKPKYFPLWLWRVLGSVFLDVPKLQAYLERGEIPR